MPRRSSGHPCHHCTEWVAAGAPHDSWSTTEAALIEHLSDDLRDAWERLREAAAGLGEQRIYASGTCIMFARATCYAFVRPKRSLLELCIFLGREGKAPQIRRADRRSKAKVAHTLRVTHRDEVEGRLTGWLQEAYALQDLLPATPARRILAQRASVSPR